MAVKLVCPHCETQNVYDVSAHQFYDMTCPECDNDFVILLAMARSKRSRGNRKTNSRTFTIRAILEDREELLKFVSDTYEDIDLKAKDEFAMSYIDDKPILVQNFKVGTYWSVNLPEERLLWGRIFIAIAIVAAILTLLYIWIF
jgi:hypothetical protein